jgi:hypothetical protein
MEYVGAHVTIGPLQRGAFCAVVEPCAAHQGIISLRCFVFRVFLLAF